MSSLGLRALPRAMAMLMVLAMTLAAVAPPLNAQVPYPQPVVPGVGGHHADFWQAPRLPAGVGTCPGGVCPPGVVDGSRVPRTFAPPDVAGDVLPGGQGNCPGGVCPVVPDLTTPAANTARFYEPAVQVTKGNAGGSGVVIGYRDGQAVVLTAWHVVEGPGRLTVYFPTRQQRVAGQIIAQDKVLDVAAIAVAVDFTPAVAPLAHGEPAAGESVVVAGFGGGRWRERAGSVLGVFDHGMKQAADLGVSPLSIPGDSGGPIYAPSGDVVSIIWGGPARRPGGPLIRTQGVRTTELRHFAEKLNLPFCLTPNTQQLQQAIDDLKAAQSQLQSRLVELERQRDTLIRTIEQGDHATAQKLLDDVRQQWESVRAELNAAKAEAAAAQTAAAEIRGETSGLRKLIDQAFQRIAEAAQQRPEASLPDILKEAGLATARDAAASRVGEDRLERLIATIAAAQEAKAQGDSPAKAAVFTYLETLGLPAGLLALAAALWKRKKE